MLLCCGAGTALVAVKRAVEKANDTPSGVEVGSDFRHDGFDAAAGWEVVEADGRFALTGLSLTNDALTPRPAFLEFTVYRDDAYVATISCSTKPIPHGDSRDAGCFSGDAYADYDDVRVADTF
ncbi:hypothetical protein [Nocardioides humilatus]|uniref:hypothetical protein n=1 Tax=Nocardioides humilatus TaxID=2607660 RepID=UPI00165F4844|nr:hypothetical protein [Nocardioides humilatus]